MKRTFVTAALFSLVAIGSAHAQNTMVGGESMMPAMNIVENAMNSEDHTTLVAAVKAGDLVEALQGEGPLTVFAPVNDAFENLPEGTVESLLMEENKEALQGVLTYHVVAGKFDFEAIKKLIMENDGTAELTTLSGGTLWATMNGMHNIMIQDENGGAANISVYDVYQSNGVIHVVDSVLLPKM